MELKSVHADRLVALSKVQDEELWGSQDKGIRPAVSWGEGQLGTAKENIYKGGALELKRDLWRLLGGHWNPWRGCGMVLPYLILGKPPAAAQEHKGVGQ